MFSKKIISCFYAGLLLMVLFSGLASAVVLPGLVDRAGNPVHSADEFKLSITTTVALDPYGYRYSYDLYSDVTSVQTVDFFMLQLPDVGAFVSAAASPWGMPGPVGADFLGKPNPIGTKESVRWVAMNDMNSPIPMPLLQPGATLTGFSFVSPYPPGIVQAYAEGITNGPYFDDVPPDPPAEFSNRTPYGPGKIFPVIGPVKPAVVGGSNYTILSCAGLLCSVQISALGPQDVNGTLYTYNWFGAFGAAVGATPIVSMPAGTYPVQLSISNPAGVLATATQNIVVPLPPIAAITPAQLAALTPSQLAAFIAALTPVQVAALSPTQLAALTPTQVAVVIVSLTPAQISSLTPLQLTGAKVDNEKSEEDPSSDRHAKGEGDNGKKSEEEDNEKDKH